MVSDIKALYKWNRISKFDQSRITNNVFCRTCYETTIVDFHIVDGPYGIVLQGQCKSCKDQVARVVEKEWYEDELESYPTQEEIERKLERIYRKNHRLILLFKKWLIEKNLTRKTITKHLDNVTFYLNEFLCYYEPIEAKDGFDQIVPFLDHWFVVKTSWATPIQVKENATSIKKFYGFMAEIGKIKKEDYQSTCAIIKSELPQWMENAKF